MKTSLVINILRWIRSQIIGILIAIIALLVATVYAAPYSPSAFGFAKYNIACGAVGTNHAFCVRIDTTTGDSSCRYASDVSDTYGSWVNCHRLNADPNDMNPW